MSDDPYDDLVHYLQRHIDFRLKYLHDGERPSGRYSSMEELVVTEGKRFPIARNRKRLRRGKAGACYANATRLALRSWDEEIIYCEGWAIGRACIPLMHAWVLVDGEIVDTTWDGGVAYLGIAFTHDYLRSRIMKDGYFGLIDAWWADYPLLLNVDLEPADYQHPIMRESDGGAA